MDLFIPMKVLVRIMFFFLKLFIKQKFSQNRLWRKTRYPYTEDCYGADANRNFDSEWMGPGASDDPCSEYYAGPHAWSEVESYNLAVFYSEVPNAVVLIAFHSYGQYLLFPFAHDLRADNYDELMVIGNATVNTIEQVHGTQYVAGTFFEALCRKIDIIYLRKS